MNSVQVRNGSATGRARSGAGSTIERVEVHKVYVPFHHEVEWSAGKRAGITRLVVQVHTADGTVGLGETICLLEFIEPVLTRTVVPLAMGEDAFDIERIVRKVEGAGYYHHKRALVMALAALEIALWDIVGKRAGLALCQLWGGRYRASVPLVGYVQTGDPARVAAEASRLAAEGFGTIKLKIGMDPRNDIDLVRAAREAIGPDIKLRADVNGAWTIGTAKSQLRKLERYDLEYIEQPLPLEDLPGHALLRQQTSVPIALDESAYTLQDVMAIVRQEAADVVLLDAHEAGGLSLARKAAAVCESAGIPVTLHSGGEMGISHAANLHLAQSIPNLMLAIDTQYLNLSSDVITAPFQHDRGTMQAPSGPGLGVTLEPRQLEALRTEEIPNPYLDPARPGWFPTKPQY